MAANRVYVGNLPWSVSWQDLKDRFATIGPVIRSDIFEDHQGRSRGCGIIEFENESDALRAIEELNDTEIDGRQIFVREDREDGATKIGMRRPVLPPPSRYRSGPMTHGMNFPPVRYPVHDMLHPRNPEEKKRQIFVSNLPWRVSWQDLKDIFRDCGSIIRADVLRHPDGRSKGIGIVLFNDEESVSNAIANFNEVEYHGRVLTVRVDRNLQ